MPPALLFYDMPSSFILFHNVLFSLIVITDLLVFFKRLTALIFPNYFISLLSLELCLFGSLPFSTSFCVFSFACFVL
jgi:hypothetical protein